MRISNYLKNVLQELYKNRDIAETGRLAFKVFSKHEVTYLAAQRSNGRIELPPQRNLKSLFLFYFLNKKY